ncbi:MAG: MJ1477/TM1410 family putative glycoside hydrolase [Hyphomicrobiaceae bacterium]
MRAIGWLLSVVATCCIAFAGAAASDGARRALLDASSWTYQLQDAKRADLGRTAYDVVIVDAFFGTQADVEALKRKPLGGRRLVISYLSIGEAEIYRYYWARCCKGRQRPDWVLSENKRWKGNYRVRFWHPEWRAIVYEDADSYLKRIVDLGFDGVYLDRIDVHAEVSAPGIDAKAEMIGFVKALAAKAKELKPGFLVIAQNAEELLEDASYVGAIDGIAKEDLLFGVGGEGRRNEASMVSRSKALLARAREAGKQVMVVEYLQDPRTIAETRTEIQELGFVPYFAPRGLERLQVESLEDEDSH